MFIFRQLKEYFWSERILLFASIFMLVCSTALGLVYPNLLRFLIDDVIGDQRYYLVPYLALAFVGVVVVKASFLFLHAFFGGRLGNRVAYNLRNALYEKLQYLSFQYYDKAKTGDLMSRLTADLEGIRQFIGYGFAQLLNLFLMVGFGFGMMLTIHWKLTLITMLPIPLLVFTALRFESKIHPAFRLIRKSFSNLTTAVQENITGVRTVKAFAREPYELEKFAVRSEDYKTNHIDTAHIWARYFPVMELVANLCVVILLLAGGYFVITDSMSLGDMVAFMTLIWFVIGPMWGLGFHINNYTQSKASGERVLEILHQYVHVKDEPRAAELQKEEVKGHVRFDRVTFAYPDNQPALTDISLDVPAGSVIGILGGTGSGKTTIIQLLQRAYNVKDGAIYLDGRNMKEIALESLRRQMAVVFQETFLFSSTIRNNIAYGQRDVPMDRIIEAAKLAQAHDFIMELPLGYDTVVGERGLGLSGGQKQRLAIARAILKDPRILILDDATSAVDMETEHQIQAGLRRLMKGRTTFVIAHRISSLKHADHIIVLDEGRIVQRGAHVQLLKEPGIYQDTYRIQYADDEERNGETARRRAN